MAARTLSLIIFVLLAVSIVGCRQGQEQEDSEKIEIRTNVPPADARKLWHYFMRKNHHGEWGTWPDTKGLLQGELPHGKLVEIFVNDIALEASASGADVLPPGSCIVKRNYLADTTLTRLTVMYKVEGYDKEANDWFWAQYRPTGLAEMAGKVPGCIECHLKVADNDYLFIHQLNK
jgi:hypothetical protein